MDSALERVQSDNVIKELCYLVDGSPQLVVMWLYGSRARGDHHSESDYDLAVAFESSPDSSVELSLRPHNLASDWSYALSVDISVVDINIAPIPLAYSVVSEGVVVVCKSSLRLRREEQRVWSMWEEYEYEHNRWWA